LLLPLLLLLHQHCYLQSYCYCCYCYCYSLPLLIAIAPPLSCSAIDARCYANCHCENGPNWTRRRKWHVIDPV
jgi:hypothetical protein